MRKIILLVSLIFLVSCAKNVPVLNEKSDIEETFLVKEYSIPSLVKEKFLELVVDRIIEVIEVVSDVEDGNLQGADSCWNKFVNLEVKPHPGVEHPETIKHELKFDGDIKVISVRLALAQYWLQHPFVIRQIQI